MPRNKSLAARRLLPKTECHQCLRTYTPSTRNQRFCTSNCAAEYTREQKIIKALPQTKQDILRKLKAANPLNLKEEDRSNGYKLCYVCSKRFYTCHKALTCSPECTKRQRKDRARQQFLLKKYPNGITAPTVKCEECGTPFQPQTPEQMFCPECEREENAKSM